jgi:curli biogenesis system outer membrane secretion channel CsgG
MADRPMAKWQTQLISQQSGDDNRSEAFAVDRDQATAIVGVTRSDHHPFGLNPVQASHQVTVSSTMKNQPSGSLPSLLLAACMILAGCATETSQAIAPTKVEAASRTYNGPKSAVVVGKFENKSNYMRGIFSDGTDRLGGQAKTILISHLQQSGRFSVMDRENMEENQREASFTGQAQKLKGAAYVITGDVTEFGRKEIGDQQLFGILGEGKKQSAYSKVTLNVVDVLSSEVVFSVQGAGEYALSNREIVGFGGTASYDATLNGKVLDLAMRQAVDALVAGIESGQWKVQQ